MKKILLTGSEGQVGQELQQTLATVGEIIPVNRQLMNLTSPKTIRCVIQEIQPDIIVNAAAYTAVDQAEKEAGLAFAVNSIAPKIIAEEAQTMGAFLLHISTDYVFDGRKNTPYLEEDDTQPINVYGQSKLEGEQGIQKYSDHYAILRTAWVYGTKSKGNFIKTMLRLGQQRDKISVVVDQMGTPTWAKDIAITIAQLLKTVPLTNTAQIYHFTNTGVASWYDLAVTIFEEARKIGFPLTVNEVIPITTADYPTPAKRPAYSVLSTQKITKTLDNYPPYWRSSLQQMLQQLYDT